MSSPSGSLAPIVLFTFKRPEHTRRTLEALARNPEFATSPLHVQCDAARHAGEADAVEQTREVVRLWAHPNKTVLEAASNLGLARSIIGGVTQLCEAYGRVIVVEDDLIVAPVFLNYMNRALDRYADEPRAMQISGHMFAVELDRPTDAAFMPFTSSWGWATWERAWKRFDPDMLAFDQLAGDRAMRKRFDLDSSYPYFSMLKRQRAGAIDSWAIRWYLSVFMDQGLVLYPLRSLVTNEGFDGSGTHAETDASAAVLTACLPDQVVVRLPEASVDADVFRAVSSLLREHYSFWRRALRRATATLA